MVATIPSDAHASGDPGHTTDHNNISDVLAKITGVAPGGTVALQAQSVLPPSGDTTGAADTTAINNMLGTTPGAVAVLGPGTFYLKSDVLLQAAGQQLRGQGVGSTIISPVNTGATFTSAMVNVTADKCRVRDISFMGISGTVTSNTAVSAIQINGAFDSHFTDIYGQYINGWLIDLESTGSSTHFKATRVRAQVTAGGIKLEGNGHTVGATLMDCGSAQCGAASGVFQNLDGLQIHNAFDVTGNNLNFSVANDTTTGGHGFHLLGHVSNIFLDVIDCGGFSIPAAGDGQAGIMIEDDGTGHASTVHISHGVFQTWDCGVYVKGPSAFDVHFSDCIFANNQSHGARVATTFANPAFFENCQFGTSQGANGQGAASLTAGTQLYDLYWNSTATGAVRDCDFGSAIVAANSVGVQQSIGIPSGNQTQVIYPRFTGTSAAASNWFSNKPANLKMFGAAPASFTPANPASTVSATLVMMGLGSTCTFTPAVTGTVLVTVTGYGVTATAAVNFTVGARFGTGTAPANGAAVTGTRFGSVGDPTVRGTAVSVPGGAFAFTAVVSLTAGTAYWFDLALLSSNAADAASVSNVAMSFTELSL